MTFEELLQFKKDVADPAMKRFMDNTVLTEGTCFIDNLELYYLDGRNLGIESIFIASGLTYKDGSVQPYRVSAEDVTFEEFIHGMKDCQLISDGRVFISDELKELELNTTIRSAGVCTPIINDLGLLRTLPCCFQSEEYYKMSFLNQNKDKPSLCHQIESTGHKTVKSPFPEKVPER